MLGLGLLAAAGPLGCASEAGPRSAVLPGLVGGGAGLAVGPESRRLDGHYAGGGRQGGVVSRQVVVERRSVDRQRSSRGRILDWSWTETRVIERRTR